MTIRFYYRYSPRPDETGPASLRRQCEACWGYARAKHADKTLEDNCVRFYSDENVSGGTFNRPGLQKLLSDLEPGDVVIAASHDRLARDMSVFAAIHKAAIDAGATIEYADGTTPGDTPEGRLIGMIMMAFAEYERDRTRTRTKTALAKRKQEGKRVGRVPIGWREISLIRSDGVATKRLEPHDPEIRAIVYACARREQGQGWRHITDTLNRMFGVGKRSGEPWTADCIRKAVKKNKHWAYPEDGAMDRIPEVPC